MYVSFISTSTVATNDHDENTILVVAQATSATATAIVTTTTVARRTRGACGASVTDVLVLGLRAGGAVLVASGASMRLVARVSQRRR